MTKSSCSSPRPSSRITTSMARRISRISSRAVSSWKRRSSFQMSITWGRSAPPGWGNTSGGRAALIDGCVRQGRILQEYLAHRQVDSAEPEQGRVWLRRVVSPRRDSAWDDTDRLGSSATTSGNTTLSPSRPRPPSPIRSPRSLARTTRCRA